MKREEEGVSHVRNACRISEAITGSRDFTRRLGIWAAGKQKNGPTHLKKEEKQGETNTSHVKIK